MEDIHGTIAEGGRIVIPADYRRALGLKVGDEVILRMADGEVHILTRRQAIKKAQALVRKHVPERNDWFESSSANGEARPLMSKYVLDASAVLTVRIKSPGKSVLKRSWVRPPSAPLTSRDHWEVDGNGMNDANARASLEFLHLEVVDFDIEMARLAGISSQRPRNWDFRWVIDAAWHWGGSEATRWSLLIVCGRNSSWGYRWKSPLTSRGAGPVPLTGRHSVETMAL